MKPIMIVGGISYSNTSNPCIGGTTVLLDNFINYLSSNNIPYIHVSTNKYRGRKLCPIWNYLYMLCKGAYYAPKVRLFMVNISSNYGNLIMLPYFIFLGIIFNKLVYSRQFAGSLNKYLEEKEYRKKITLWSLKRVKKAFFETKELIAYFDSYKINTYWFPNVRKGDHLPNIKSDRKNVFAFVSRVTKEKGIDELLAAFSQLGSSYNIDIYGPLNGYKAEELSIGNVSYKGLLCPNDVINTLSTYDALVLPTKWKAEGYPGIVLEAYAAGIPVIISKIGGIPEIVKDGKTGYLTDCNDVNTVVNAIKKLGEINYTEMCHNCRAYYEEFFNSDNVNSKILSVMNI